MIALPLGMTPEQYYATPEGRRVMAQNSQFQRDTAAKQADFASRGRSPAAGRQPVTRQSAAGSAQSRQDPYASSTKSQGVNDIAREIEAALGEMAPELDPSERRLLAAELAQEYSQDRQAAARELARGPAAEAPDPSREWKWDGNKYEYTDTPEYQARAESRKAQRMETEEQQARRVQRVRQQQMRNNVAMAQKSERDRPGSAGAFGQMAKKLGRPAAPGMAQPKQPQSQGTPYGGPSQQDMYWQLVNSGMDPAQASGQVRKAFKYAPQ